MRSRRFDRLRFSSCVHDGHGLLTALLALPLLSIGCGGELRVPTPSETEPVADRTSAGPERVVHGRAPAAVNGMPSVVILTPDTPTDFPIPDEPAAMDQFSMMFVPAQLLTRVGQPVRFANSDQELHNIRVVENESQDTIFNVGTPAGIFYEHVFDRAGTYAVSCDVHTAMGGVIIATDSPYAVTAGADGAFEIADVPPGTYTATVYTGADRIDHPVVIDAVGDVLRLDGS